MTPHRNVTLSLPEPLLRQLRVFAAKENRSMSNLMAEAIANMIDPGCAAQTKARRLIERMRNPPGKGIPGGKINWSRAELHER